MAAVANRVASPFGLRAKPPCNYTIHLDTRSKILAPGQTPPSAPATVIVTGYFDPLTAAHVRSLLQHRKLHSRLIVAVLDPPSPILPVRARAELLAALRCVDQVLVNPALPLDGVSCEAIDLDIRERLVEHVRTRHVIR